MKYVAVDTNQYLTNLNELDKYNNIVYLSHVNRELEKHKSSYKKELAFQARRATRYVEENKDRFHFDLTDYEVKDETLDSNYEDNHILFACIEKGYSLLTGDITLKHKAKCYGVEVIEPEDSDDDDYKGYKFVDLSQDEIMYFYENKDENLFNLEINQYLIIRDTDQETKDRFRWDGEAHKPLSLPPKKFIKPKNDLQACALDLLHNKEIPIKFVAGTYGSGKTFLATRMAVYHTLEKGNFSKIMMVRNPIGTGEEIGFLTGDKDDKTKGFFKPIVQHLDQGEAEAEMLKHSNQLVAEIPYYAKGISVHDTYMVVDEAEDMDKKILKTIGTRPEEDSVVAFTGDWNQSEDKYAANNGMKLAINEIVKGNPLCGAVVLDIDVRSEASKIFADW